MLSCRAHFHCLAGFRDAFISTSALLFSVKNRCAWTYWTVKLHCYLSCSFTLSLCTDYTLYVLCPVHTRHVARERSPGSPFLGLSTLFYHTARSPERRAFPTHTTRTHTDTLLTLFLASLAVIRVELGVRGLEHTRGGWGLMPDVKGLPLENPGYVPDSHQRDKTVLWRRVGC